MRPVLPVLYLLLFSIICQAQKLSYELSFPNLQHHEAVISLTVTGNNEANTIFRMSRSSPGRYATHEFAKNIYNVAAFDKNGSSLIINRTAPDIFEVPGKHELVKFSYTLFGNHADGTYASIDDDAILLNAPASFIWVPGLENAGIEVKFELPAEKHWSIATQMLPTADSSRFTVPNMQYLMDCPVLIGNLTWVKWNMTNPGGKTYNIRLALHAKTDRATAENFAAGLKKLLLEEQAVFNELPDYDNGTYTFLASIDPFVNGDGMEHRNSTMITTNAVFDGGSNLYNTFSHEFFHCWNVERIRPASLEPFDFTHSNISNALWFAEGFTQYYGELLMLRSGLGTIKDFEYHMGVWINAKEHTPAGKNYSPVQMSQNAVFTDAGTSIDKNNRPNTYVSYYYYGAAIALALDLELRIKYNIALDSFMLLVWQKFGKPAIPYTLADLQLVLAQLTSDAQFAATFFKNYIYGHESIDYSKLLSHAGYQLQPKNAGKAWMGDILFKEQARELELSSNTMKGSPLYNAGLDNGDKIISIDGTAVNSEAALRKLLQQYQPGQTVTIAFLHHDQLRSSQLQFASNPSITVLPVEMFGQPVSKKEKQFRANWLDSKLR